MTMGPFKAFFVFISFVNLGICVPLSCPNLEEMRPCSCKRVAYGLQIVCADFNDTSSLRKAFKILRDYRVQLVVLHGLFLKETLPSDLFDGLQIKEIRIENSNLLFPQPAFKGLDSSLTVLMVSQNSMIKSKERFSLARLTKLDELNVQHYKLRKIEDKWLTNKVPNIHTIVLDYNDIDEIESHAFANLPEIRTISLADNRIKQIQRSMLPRPATYLRRIDLSHNVISELPSNFFFDMPSLKEVILSGNDLKILPESTWMPVWQQLSQVFLFDCNIDCRDYINWITIHKPYELIGTCATPKERQGKELKDIYTSEDED